MADDPKYGDFDIHSTPYTVVNGHEINLDVLIPKNIVTDSTGSIEQKKRHPLLIRFHGGGLMSGSSIHAPWFPDYILDHGYKSSAVILSADHRFLPECNGLDILDDISSLWAWVQSSLQSFICSFYPSLEVDTTRILATGESSGGYIVVQAALSGLARIRAIISAYPMLDLRAPHFTEKYEKILTGAAMVPPKVLENHLNGMKRGEIVTRSTPPDRVDMANAVIQQGRFLEFFGEDEVLFPLERVKSIRGKASTLPRLWIYHGKQDTGVPTDGTVKFTAEAMKVWPDEELRLDMPDGEHGLHKGLKLESTPWLSDGVKWVTEKWLDE